MNKTLKSFFLAVVFLLCKNFLSAQGLDNYVVENAGATVFSYPCTGTDNWPISDCPDKEDMVKTEYPPWIIAGTWRTYFFTDGFNSSAGSSPLSMVTSNEINIKSTNPNIELVTKKSVCPTGYPWRLSYYSVYSAQYINHPTAGPVNLAFVGGENRIMLTTDQDKPCGYNDWSALSSFLCGAWIPNNASTNWGQQYFPNDVGPIIWPSSGYFNSMGLRTGHGCANPSTIKADDGYLYVFYKDMSNEYANQLPGTIPGIKVARAPINDALNPLAYQTFYEDAGVIHWNPSLPAGFDKNNIRVFLKGYGGPLGTKILTDPGRDYTRFTVAKATGTNYYLGVGSYKDEANTWTDANGVPHTPQVTTLKYSYDLVHWFGDREINRSLTGWDGQDFNYPIFLSNDGWSNTEIDPGDFYIIGTPSTLNNIVNKYHLYFQPAQYCEDQCGNIVPCPAPPYCPDCWCPETRKAVNGASGAIDNSKGRAPFVSPNPGNGMYQLKYTLQTAATTQVNVRDLTGRLLQTSMATNRKAGTYTDAVNIRQRAKGIYLLELLVNGKKQLFKVIYQ